MCVEGWFRSFQLILQEPHGRQVSPFGHLQVESPFVAVRTAMIEWSKLQPRSGSDTQTAWRKPFLCEDLSLPSQSAERHEPVDTMGNAEFKESRPVLVGNTGSGKSSSGNTILGKFLAKLSGSSVTRECQSDSTDRSFDDDQKRMRNYTVVDMPGFGDTRLTEEEILCEDMYLPSQSAERHEPVDTMGNAEFKESRQVLVGNTGSGKSSSGNTILGQKFLAKLSGSSVTRECQSDSTDRSFDDDQKRMRNYTVVDMPGFGDTRLTEEEILCEDMYLPSQSAERHEPVDTMGNAEFKESRQVLVGNTGSGKSSSGNTILGQKFLAKLSGSSVTRECQSDSTDRSFDDDQKRMRNYTVVDMPGFGDTRLTEEEILCEDMSLPSQSAERHQPVDMMGIAELEEIRLVLVGNTGSGKSSSGNTILGQKFLAKLSGSSVTRECQSDSTDRSFDDDQKRMRNYTVVDMPGFGDTRLTEEEILCEDMYLPSQSAERHEPVDTMGNAEFKESRQVLVGNTGSGKSSSGNTILGQKFLAKLSGSSVTRECQSDSTDRSFDDDQKRMRNYTVVDMPGFGDTRLTEEEILCEDMSLPSQSAERHQPVDMMGIAELEEIRLVLVGNTGSGKSSSANTILGQKKFLAKLSGSSVTRKCQSGSTDRAFDDEQKRMRKITVVDIPGFGDTHLTEEEIHTEMAKCLYLTAPGPHAFLLVVPIGRYTDYEAQAVNHLAKIFGDDAVKSHTIVLFTKGDSLEGMEFDEYLEESPDGLRELIDKCGGRYHVFNNKENYGNATQVQELMMKVDKMVKESETEFYTNAMFEEAEAAMREEQKRKQEMESETVPQSIRKRKLQQRKD
nr:uncharacterized protein LOC125984099 isoform X2 [Syngnathus scovelli]